MVSVQGLRLNRRGDSLTRLQTECTGLMKSHLINLFRITEAKWDLNAIVASLGPPATPESVRESVSALILDIVRDEKNEYMCRDECEF